MVEDWIKLDYSDSELTVNIHYKGHDVSAREAIEYSVKQIISECPPPYNILASGGVDTQSVLSAWHQYAPDSAKSQTHVYTYVYNNHTNQYDIHNVPVVCNRYGFQHTFRSFDLMYFLTSGECLELQKKYRTSSMQIATHMKFLEDFRSGTNIMSGNVNNFRSNQSLGIALEQYGMISFVNEHNTHNSDCKFIPFFFNHNDVIGTRASLDPAELSLVLKSELVTSRKFSDVYAIKCETYRRFELDIEPQQNKFSGFEKFKHLYESQHPANPMDRILYSYKPSKWSFDITHRYKVAELAKQPTVSNTKLNFHKE